MARPRVGHAGHERKCGSEWEPNHVVFARLLSRAMFGLGAAVARITRWSERAVQYFMEPQGHLRSPIEESVVLLCAILEAGGRREDVAAILDEMRARVLPEPSEGSIAERLGEMVRTGADVTSHTVEELLDGHVSAEDIEALVSFLAAHRTRIDDLEAAARVAQKHEGPEGKLRAVR